MQLSDELLNAAVSEMESGLIDADLGGGLVKKRIAIAGRGKRGSTRTLIATNKHDRWFSVFGFEKNEKANIDAKELKALRLFASDLLSLSVEKLNHALKDDLLQEINDDC